MYVLSRRCKEFDKETNVASKERRNKGKGDKGYNAKERRCCFKHIKLQGGQFKLSLGYVPNRQAGRTRGLDRDYSIGDKTSYSQTMSA